MGYANCTVTVNSGDLDRPSGSVARRLRPGTATDSENPGTVVAGPSVSTSITPVTHRVTVAVVTPRGVVGAATTDAQARAQLAAASQYWAEQSGGTVTFTPDSVTVPMALAAGCSDHWAMWREAASRWRGRSGSISSYHWLKWPQMLHAAGVGQTVAGY